MTLDEARDHIGAAVTYHPDGGEPEQGTIAAASTVYVFVQYPGERGTRATYPEDLTLISEADLALPWIVHHRGGWCALPPGAEPDPEAFNDPTLCGYVVNLRGGSKHGRPTCPECLAKLADTAAGEAG